MKSNSQLSDVLHVLLHLAQAEAPLTSDALAAAMHTHPVVLRRLMAGLRAAGFVSSGKGHGGGWAMSASVENVTLGDVHRALGSPALVSFGFRDDRPECLVAQVVNESLQSAMLQAESVLLARLETMTLADLLKGFDQRMKAHRPRHAPTFHRLEDHHGQD